MLILERKNGERIIINDDLIIQIITHRNLIKLGFEGPREKYIIDRYEIYERKLKGRG